MKIHSRISYIVFSRTTERLSIHNSLTFFNIALDHSTYLLILMEKTFIYFSYKTLVLLIRISQYNVKIEVYIMFFFNHSLCVFSLLYCISLYLSMRFLCYRRYLLCPQAKVSNLIHDALTLDVGLKFTHYCKRKLFFTFIITYAARGYKLRK